MSALARRLREAAAVLAVFVALTSGMMWQQVRHIGDSAVPHQDVYFNMWRLQWVAHALATSPKDLFNGNIFYPEPRTLTFSDAMLVEGVTAAPLSWLGVRPVLVHNIMLLAAIVMSSAAMFALVRYLTGSRGAGLLAGAIFGFAPYRFEHIMHMELQWTMWMPLAFLAMHRTFDSGRIRDGLATGAAMALQMLSSVYYGVFLGVLLTASGVVMLIGARWTHVRRAMIPFATGAVLAATVAIVYAQPYLATRDRVGERPAEEIRMFAARPADYLVAPPANWLYGELLESRGGSERHLFPGAVPFLLAIVGVLLRPPSRVGIVYFLMFVAAFEASLGFGGYSYTFLYDQIAAFHGLRAPARLGIFVVFSLAVLAGFGYVWLAAALRARARLVLLLTLLTAVLAEDFTSVPLVTYPNTVSPVYRLLAHQPWGVVAEFPMPKVDSLPGQDPKYTYLSVFHWKPLVNGYSGFYPPSYIRRILDLRRFPEPFSLRVLRRADVRYMLIHESGYGNDRAAYDEILRTLDNEEGVGKLGVFSDGEASATLYVLR
jgi:hypothetical protein